MMRENKTPAQAVNEAVEDTPVPVSTKKAAELKFSGSPPYQSAQVTIIQRTGFRLA